MKRYKSRLIPLLTVLCLLFTACTEQKRSLTEAEQSAFGHYLERLDTTLLNHNLQQLLLDDDHTSWKADKAVKEWYAQQQQPVWYTHMGVAADADTLLALLRRELPLNGLDTTVFFLPQLAADLDVVHQLTFDSLKQNINEVLPRLDYLLSKAFVRYITGQHYGFTRPDKYLNHLDHKANSKDPNEYAQLFDYEIKAPDYDESLKMLTSTERTNELRNAHPQEHVYEALYKQIGATNDADMRRKLAVNMERCRWQIHHPSKQERHILVNLAAQQLWACCTDSVVNMRICCGATTHKTPLPCSEIGYLQVNPEWIIPLNIIKAEVSRHAGDSAFFARNDYSIVDKESLDTLNVGEVTADDLDSGRLRVVQKSGAGNSLGRIAFRFPNNFSIYLHDTNNRRAFERERRTLSHGCVRVQKPFELACFLLPDADEWKLEQLRISMDIPPISQRGKDYLKKHEDDPRPYRLISYHGVSPKMPLYIVYFTTYPNPESGEVESWPDLYDYDSVVAREMGNLLQP